MALTEKQLVDFLPNIRKFAMLWRNVDNVEDLIQIAAMRIWQKRELFEGSDKDAKKWMGTICYREWSSCNISKASRPVLVLGNYIPEQVQEPNAEHYIVLKRAIDKLSTHQNGLMIAFSASASQEEVAAKFNIPTGTVKSRVSRGREWLKQEMDQ